MRKHTLRGSINSIILASLLLLSSAAFSTCLAASHYVDNAASGSNDGSSWANAWKSFGSINWSDVQPGDTIFISGGSTSKTYQESLVVGRSGATGQFITITRGQTAGHNGQVIIDGQKSRGILVNLVSRNYVTVSQLSLTNPQVADGGRAINVKGCNNVIIDGNTVTHSARAGVFIENSSSCIIRRNDISTDSNVNTQTDTIYSQRNTNITFDGNRLVVNNNESSGHDDCLQSYLDNSLIVRNNYCAQNNSKTSNAQGIYITTCSGTMQIYNNVINAPHTYNSLIAIRLPQSGIHGIVVSNTLIGGKYGALKVEGDANAVIKNNIIWKCNGGVALTYSGSVNQVANNILDDRDPKLDSNFMPLGGSPAIDAGAVLDGAYCTDKNGTSRPQGRSFDIGAYENGGGSQLPAQLTAPRNFRVVM